MISTKVGRTSIRFKSVESERNFALYNGSSCRTKVVWPDPTGTYARGTESSGCHKYSPARDWTGTRPPEIGSAQDCVGLDDIGVARLQYDIWHQIRIKEIWWL